MRGFGSWLLRDRRAEPLEWPLIGGKFRTDFVEPTD